MNDLFSGLVAVVQYRRKYVPGRCDSGITWHAMAAFDQKSVAEKYADDCGKDDRPWEYRVVDVPAREDVQWEG